MTELVTDSTSPTRPCLLLVEDEAGVRTLVRRALPEYEVMETEDAESALARLRDSRIGLLNAIYAAVIRLIASSWYLIPENALTTGYPGPPKKVTDTTPAAASVKEVTP